MNSFNTKVIAAALAGFLATTSVFAQQTSHVTALESIPAESTAYMHVDLQGLTKFQGMDFFKALVREVLPELDELAVEQCGIPASQFKEAATIVPTVDAAIFGEMIQGNTKDFLSLVTFTASIDPQKVIRPLNGKWDRFNAKGRDIFVCEERKMCVYHYADNAIAFGTREWVTWFIQENDESTGEEIGLSETFSLAKTGQVTVGVNGKMLPQNMKESIGQGLETLEWVGCTLDLSQGVRMKLSASFGFESNATTAANQLENFTKLAKFQLKGLESMAERQFKSRDSSKPETAMMALSQLAMSRYGIRTLDNFKLQQTENRVDAEVHAREFDVAPMAIVCLSAIQAVGTNANAKFESIAAELSAK